MMAGPSHFIFQGSFLVSRIMCFDGCGKTIQNSLRACIKDCIEKKILPSDAQLMMDAEPNGLGLHKLTIYIESTQDNLPNEKDLHSILYPILLSKIKGGEEFIDESKETKNKKTNWMNMLINFISMSVVISCSMIFPPSILLTIGLTVVSFLTTAFTSREYLLDFFRSFRTKSFANMATTISLGWFLSLGHTLFHVITMVPGAGFSMVFMSFLMPLILVACVNGMDEIKRLVMEKSKKIQLKGLKNLFPQMSETYRYYPLNSVDSDKIKNKDFSTIQSILDTNEAKKEQRNVLKEGMLIAVDPGNCFPVDCTLVHGNTIIDASLLTGEPQQSRQVSQSIPAGAINLGQPVVVYVEKDPYSSTVNSLLFRSNRARDDVALEAGVPKFAYLYAALVIVGMVGAILAPFAFGVITLPLVMQNVMGILFSLCPCTIAIAHELPKLISMHHRSSKGIHLRDEHLMRVDSNDIHTVVFDKTGTLTTGKSVVESSNIHLKSSLWERIYLLEKKYGKEHPLAKAIQAYYESENKNKKPLFDKITECKIDEKNRGIIARVQGKMLQIGSHDYLKSKGVRLLPELDKCKMEKGFSAVCVAEEGRYEGVIYVKHEVRDGVLETLSRLKEKNKKIIMLTGDNDLSAKGFNRQINSAFAPEHIHAGQTPKNKESFLEKLMGNNPKGVWFCGDGLNDAPCCRMVSQKGGVSCAISPDDKSAFFTDISLNGSLDYLFKHKELNHALKQNIIQNKGILIYSTLAFLAFIISFSVVGIAVSPLIPMAIMMSTTFFILFNSYRTQLAIDNTLDTVSHWSKKCLSSNVSIGLLLGASTLLICSVLVATISTGGLALPIITWSVGAAMAFSSVCTLSAIALFSPLLLLTTSFLLSEYHKKKSPDCQSTSQDLNNPSSKKLEESSSLQ